MENDNDMIYTKEYFLDSTEPYEKLYQIESSFEREESYNNWLRLL